MNAALKHSIRCLNAKEIVPGREREELATDSPDGGAQMPVEVASPGLGELIPSARHTHLGSSQAGSYTPKDEPRVCLCHHNEGLSLDAPLAATDQELRGVGDRIRRPKAGDMGVQLDLGSNPASVTYQLCDQNKFPNLLKFQFPCYKVEVITASSPWVIAKTVIPFAPT